MLLHDNLRATDDTIKLFFMEVYELFIKVYISSSTCITCGSFQRLSLFFKLRYQAININFCLKSSISLSKFLVYI